MVRFRAGKEGGTRDEHQHGQDPVLVQTCCVQEQVWRRRRDGLWEEGQPSLERWLLGKSQLSTHGNSVFPAPWVLLGAPCAARLGFWITYTALPQFPHQSLGIYLLLCDSPKPSVGMSGYSLQGRKQRKIPLDMAQSCYPIPPLAIPNPE